MLQLEDGIQLSLVNSYAIAIEVDGHLPAGQLFNEKREVGVQEWLAVQVQVSVFQGDVEMGQYTLERLDTHHARRPHGTPGDAMRAASTTEVADAGRFDIDLIRQIRLIARTQILTVQRAPPSS